jgi:hypothetical protein
MAAPRPALSARLALAPALLGIGLLAEPAHAQRVAAPGARTGDTLVVVPEPEFEKGGLHRTLLGADYRYLWTAPIRLPVFDLDRVGGGIRPTKVGGGKQTASLRLQGADGREYAFRSLSKDPAAILPDELRETPLGDVLRDQIAASHPTGALVVARLLDAVGVLHVRPVLGIMPDDPRLGEHRDRFAGLIGFIEERPRAGDDVRADFGGAEDVESTHEMFDELERSPREQVDLRAFLKARLTDLFLGDWDRHHDQWRWAQFPGEHAREWHPIPRDRDQAFGDYQGWLLGIARMASAPQLVRFQARYPRSLVGLAWNGRVVDRHLLGGVQPAVYDTVARELQAQLTDSVIGWAVAALPPEHRALDSARLERILRARRDSLPAAALRYAGLLAGEINLNGSDGADVLRIVREGREVEVALFMSRDSADKDVPYRRRRTSSDLTRELRVWLHGGRDTVLVRGQDDGGPPVFVVLGGGDDHVTDESQGGSVQLFDDKGTLTEEGREHRVYTRPWSADEPTEKNPWPPRDWGQARQYQPIVGYRSEYGLELGLRVTNLDYGFRTLPHRTRISGAFSMATLSGGVRLEALWERYRRMSRERLEVFGRVTQLGQIGFYGFGNESDLDLSDEDANFNRVRNTQATLRTTYSLPTGARSDLAFGAEVRYTDTRLDEDRLIGQAPPPGTPSYGQAGLRADWTLDTRPGGTTSRSGWLVSAGGSVWPELWDVEGTVGEVHGTVGTYVSSQQLPLHPTLALRVAGRRVWGPYAYFDAAIVGGSRTVRGLREQRYAGDAGVIGNAELRLRGPQVSLIVPIRLGVLGFADAGRVWLEGESSDTWHTGVGGGVWASALGDRNVASISFASSADHSAVLFTAGFMF